MTTGYDLPRTVFEAVEAKTAGLDVHWVGRPDWRVIFKWSMLIWLFAVPWTLFSVGWTVGAAVMIWGPPSANMSSTMQTIIGIIFPLWGLPFIGIGIAMLASPIWLAQTARHTAYVVTTDALMTIAAGRSGTVTVTTLPLGQILSTVLKEWPGGYGTLRLLKGWKKDSDGDQVRDEETLVGIPEAARVEALINSLRQGSVPSPG